MLEIMKSSGHPLGADLEPDKIAFESHYTMVWPYSGEARYDAYHSQTSVGTAR